MTHDEAIQLIRRLLLAQNEEEVRSLVAGHLALIDGTFFQTAAASAQELENQGKSGAALALRRLSDQMVSLKTLI